MVWTWNHLGDDVTINVKRIYFWHFE